MNSDERSYKPYGIVELVPTDCPIYAGHENRNADLSGQRYILEAPQGKRIELMGVRSLMFANRVVIVEAKIGDDFIWGDTAVDPAAFDPYVRMKIGLVTDERPLELFVQRMPGNHEDHCLLNLTFFGRESEMTTYDHAVAQRIRAGQQGLVHAPTFLDWLEKIENEKTREVYGRMCKDLMRDYLRGHKPPEHVGKRKKVEMSDTVSADGSDPHRGVSDDGVDPFTLLLASTGHIP